jgi:hypothetical protein
MRCLASCSASSAGPLEAACAASISAALVFRRDRNAIEFIGQLDQRLVAAGDHVGDDGADGRLDVSGGLALGVEEGAETLGEIGGFGIETDRHAPS